MHVKRTRPGGRTLYPMQRPGKMPALALVSRFQDGLFVLVADQDVARASTLSDTLNALGLASKRVTSGDEVLVSLAKRTPNLLVVSEGLPILDGFELCRVLRHRPALARLPILLILSSGTEEHRLAAFEAGGDEWQVAPHLARDVRRPPAQGSERAAARGTPSLL